MNSPRRILHDKLTDIGENVDGVFFRHHQHIPDEFLSELRKERMDSLHTPAGDFHKVASIPAALVDQWAAEGFDVFRAPLKDILKRLRQEQLDAFVTSNKV